MTAVAPMPTKPAASLPVAPPTSFRVFSEQTAGLRAKSVTVDTTDSVNGTALKVTTDKSLTNPLYVMSMGMIPPASFFGSSKTKAMPLSASAQDAIKALHALGEKTGVDGVLISGSDYASFRFKGAGFYTSGGDVTARLGGAANKNQLVAAAKAVLSIATAK